MTDGPKIMSPVLLEDGRWGHTVRQSTLTTFTHLCAEQVRQVATGMVPATTTSAALIGTAVHAGIERCINEIISSAHPCDPEDQADAAMSAWDAGLAGVIMTHSEVDARRLILEATAKWRDQVMWRLDPISAEQRFDKLVLWEDEERVIWASGTIDCVDTSGVLDWKTSSGSWLPAPRVKLELADGTTKWSGGGAGKRHEKEKWDIQSTLYTWAAQQLGYEVDLFRFIVLVHGKDDVEEVAVRRGPAHVEWVRRLAVRYAREWERGTDHAWHASDAGWWCSANWCPVWQAGRCKGELFG